MGSSVPHTWCGLVTDGGQCVMHRTHLCISKLGDGGRGQYISQKVKLNCSIMYMWYEWRTTRYMYCTGRCH